jgi:hypothetical protein
MSMHREYEDHYNGKLYDKRPAQGSIEIRPTALPAVLGGHSLADAPDLRVEPAQRAEHLRAGVLGKLHAAGRIVPSLDPQHFGPQAGLWLAHIQGSRIGGGEGGNLAGLEANFIAVPNESTAKALGDAWSGFVAAALAEITHEGRQRQAEHDAELSEMRARAEMDAARSAQAAAQFRQALTQSMGRHG